MSEDQLKSFLQVVKTDSGLQEKLKAALSIDASVVIARDAGFDVSKSDFLEYQTRHTLELSDEELEGVSGGAVWSANMWLEFICVG